VHYCLTNSVRRRTIQHGVADQHLAIAVRTGADGPIVEIFSRLRQASETASGDRLDDDVAIAPASSSASAVAIVLRRFFVLGACAHSPREREVLGP